MKEKVFDFVCLVFVVAMITALLLSAGCATTYDLEVKKTDGTYVKAHSRSFRKAALFELVYNPTTGVFKVVAVGVTDDTAEVVKAAVGVVGEVAGAVVNPASAVIGSN